ncbi:MAG: HU family DNA-binding protein [Actinomycetota bacterium]|nr:HU family DNA-binding protein [Actinomycetota bacterium]
MNKTELSEAIAKRAQLSKRDAQSAVDAMVETVSDELRKGREVAITGFGKFHVAKRGARQGRNPATGEAIKIKASKSPKFTAGAGLKNATKGAK